VLPRQNCNVPLVVLWRSEAAILCPVNAASGFTADDPRPANSS